jgi:hypothetical protein
VNDDVVRVLSARLAKTDAGRTEIQRKSLPLSRPARNLLLIIDTGRPAQEWITLVQGATPADVLDLLRAGLVADQAAQPSAPAPARMSLAQALETKSYRTLYDRITAEARPRLGLIKGYKLILDVERCAGPPEIRLVALRFVEQVRVLQGDAAALGLAQTLIAPD